MKQRALALAIRRIIWAELALTTAFAIPAFAQSQPATTGTPAAAAAASGTAAAAAPASGAAATSAGASNTKNVKQLKTFEVTGSLIRQADKTGFNAVQVISQKDIQQSGATTTAQYLRDVSANSASSFNEANPDSFAPGGAGIALRGLSEKYTLVLIDGQRAAPFAFAVNGTDTFFDLNTLPTNMIDRIEIVKTGAVSQYGSDAIAVSSLMGTLGAHSTADRAPATCPCWVASAISQKTATTSLLRPARITRAASCSVSAIRPADIWAIRPIRFM
jgi:iron complex outermembrane receptor protein